LLVLFISPTLSSSFSPAPVGLLTGADSISIPPPIFASLSLFRSHAFEIFRYPDFV
jgi:hypothetical protein